MDTRTRILKSAWKLLEAEGANAVRMGDIAKAAGISRQALYLHFPARADLLIATTRYLDEVYDIESKLAPSRTAASYRRLGQSHPRHIRRGESVDGHERHG